MANTTNNEKENYSTITPTMTVLLSAQVNVGEVFSPFYYSESAFAWDRQTRMSADICWKITVLQRYP